MGFEQIEHTADVGLHVWSSTLDGLFAEAARALFDVMGSVAGPPASSTTVRLDAPDAEALLVDWLSELLYLFEAKGFVPLPERVEVTQEPWTLAATVAGPPSEAFVQHGAAVKAVTYHGIRVVREHDRAEAWVYLDI